ncbi:hypothetical protein CBR_g38511 [Chara braunii]|uniref:Reverse transcriptase domain-containing protein n=1 Tax=Chara braunii TaxID=69332 RepID=A0A388JNT9_CHABU|nr:hypothetical protein CBR_g38511 [Chara braunii]|eukprot:GBG59486.1 hypothetical protein CBR_g38511 [Chara braunii]
MQKPVGLPNRPTKHHIELLPGAVPPKGRIYRMSPAELEELRKQLETLTSKGWIRPSTSEFGAPVLFVPKGNGEFRMCIDYRGLNKITRKSTEPLPRIDDLLDMVQTEMHRIFRPYLDKFMVVYLDDILAFSKTTREHAEQLAPVLRSLRDSQYKINKEKSSFGFPSVIYLGHVISGDGLAPEAAKIAAIQEWPQPQTVRDVPSFLGLASYYRKFVRNFSAVAAPLTNLTKKDTPFLWSLHCQMAFARLKQALTRAPVLKLPDPTLPFVLTTDASQYGIGAMLQQDDGNGLQPVEYMSKKIKTQKLQDSTYENELYALVSALKHWKHFLLGRYFKIFSDHSTLQWLKSQGELNKLARYIQFIDMFDFELKHKKGCYNKVVDALSRRPDSFAFISSTHSFGEETRQTIARLLPQDPTYGPIVRNLQADPDSEPGYAMSSDPLYTYSRGEERLCIPKDQQLRTLLMPECHDARGHFGFLKSYAALSQRFFWKEMRSEMLHYVETCELCQRNKVQRKPPLGLLKPLFIPDGPAQSEEEEKKKKGGGGEKKTKGGGEGGEKKPKGGGRGGEKKTKGGGGGEKVSGGGGGGEEEERRRRRRRRRRRWIRKEEEEERKKKKKRKERGGGGFTTVVTEASRAATMRRAQTATTSSSTRRSSIDRQASQRQRRQAGFATATTTGSFAIAAITGFSMGNTAFEFERGVIARQKGNPFPGG